MIAKTTDGDTVETELTDHLGTDKRRMVELESDLYSARSTINALAVAHKAMTEKVADYDEVVQERDKLERKNEYMEKLVHDHVETKTRIIETYDRLTVQVEDKFDNIKNNCLMLHFIFWVVYSCIFGWSYFIVIFHK